MPREDIGQSKHPLTIQEMTPHMDTTKWSIPKTQTDYILCSQRWRSSIQSAKSRPGASYGSDHELLIAKFRLKVKKVGKTAGPFKYHRNEIPYNYMSGATVGITDKMEARSPAPSPHSAGTDPGMKELGLVILTCLFLSFLF